MLIDASGRVWCGNKHLQRSPFENGEALSFGHDRVKYSGWLHGKSIIVNPLAASDE